MGEHRVPLLGAAWRRNEDPAVSRDPRVRAVVGALATLPAPEMRADFRAELRAQLVAITPRIVAESARTAPTQTQRMVDVVPSAATARRPRPTPHGRPEAQRAKGARHADGFLDRLRGIHVGRPLAVVTSVIVAFAMLLGGAVVMSQKALPGDALYGLKRAGEQFELATAGSDVEKAQDHLDFATNRAQEAQALAKRLTGSALSGVHASGGGGDTAQLIRSTLQSADGDVRAAAQLLGTSAVQHSSAKPLATMTAWAPKQLQRLQQLSQSLPDPALRSQALSSLRLVQAAQARATALSAKIGCGCLTTGNRDSLGPIPCTSCTTPAQQRGTPASRHPGTTGPKPGRTTAAGGSTHTGGVVPAPASGQQTSGPGGPGLPTSTPPPLNLPTLLPTGTPSLPISGSSCGITISLPIIGGAGVGVCSGVNVNVGH